MKEEVVGIPTIYVHICKSILVNPSGNLCRGLDME